MLGKIICPQSFKEPEGGYKEFKVGDLFDIHPTKSYGLTNEDLFATKGETPVVTNTSSNNGISCNVNLEATETGGIITYSDTTTSEAIFYQPHDFIGYSHIQGLYPYDCNWNKASLLYFVTAFRKAVVGKFNYGNKFNRNIAKEIKVLLPVTHNDKIDFNFIDEFIAELEVQRLTELAAYLSVTGLKKYKLTNKEKEVIKCYNDWEWGLFNIKDLFGKSTRGKRLKSEDRISGELPFVTAGEFNEGISAFISNKVDIFSSNTTTIDMFGSAKYRNYKYGGDDHIAVVHTEKLSKMASIFVTTSIHKSSHNGQFSYSKNFYAKDADKLNILLPIVKGEPNYELMETFISAIHKIVIKNVSVYSKNRIDTTNGLIKKKS